MNSPVAPLVPRAKPTKRRPTFRRPVSKSSRRSPSKGSSPKTKRSEQLPKQSRDVSSAPEQVTNSSTEPEVSDSAKTTPSTTDISVSQESEPSNQRASSTVLGSTSSRRIKKRKQSSGLVSIGSSLKAAPLESSTRTNQPEAEDQIIPSPASPPTGGLSSPQSIAGENLAARATSISVPQRPHAQPSEHDKEALKRLTEEDPTGNQLTSFCSSFKRRKRQQRTKKTNTNAGHAAASSATTADSTVANNNATGKKSAEPTGTPVVQIVNGEIVLQESSLLVPGARRSVQEVEAEFQNVVEEDAQMAVVGASYNSFVNRKGPQHWTLEETKQFYHALRQLGTDFCSMEAFFENRTRKQLKNKYQSEYAKNQKLIEMALDPKYRTEIDLSVFDVSVDPKAIEEATKDPNPSQEPTDSPNQGATEQFNDDAGEGDDNISKEADKNIVGERQASADPSGSVWPDEEEQNEDPSQDAEQGVNEFFVHEEREDEATTIGAGSSTNVASNVDEVATTETPPKTTGQEDREVASISLVPTKSKQKAKRFKFRSSAARKRK